MSTAAISPISSPTPGCALARRRRRGRRPSRSEAAIPPGRPCRPALRLCRSTASSSSTTGYWMRRTATRPSTEIAPLATAVPLPSASAPAGSFVPSTCGRSATEVWSRASAERALAESKNVRPSSGCQDDLRGQTGALGVGCGLQVDGLLGVQSRDCEGVLELLTERGGGPHHEHARRRASTDDRPRAAGGPADPRRTSDATCTALLTVPELVAALSPRLTQRRETRRAAHRPVRAVLSRPIDRFASPSFGRGDRRGRSLLLARAT